MLSQQQNQQTKREKVSKNLRQGHSSVSMSQCGGKWVAEIGSALRVTDSNTRHDDGMKRNRRKSRDRERNAAGADSDLHQRVRAHYKLISSSPNAISTVRKRSVFFLPARCGEWPEHCVGGAMPPSSGFCKQLARSKGSFAHLKGTLSRRDHALLARTLSLRRRSERSLLR